MSIPRKLPPQIERGEFGRNVKWIYAERLGCDDRFEFRAVEPGHNSDEFLRHRFAERIWKFIDNCRHCCCLKT